MTDQSTTPGPRKNLSGTAIALRGDDIDTDRIIPARFLKAVTYAGLGAHAFADERRAWRARGELHPFDDPRHHHNGASILLVNKNFGCGSSREHAPQALRRWGIAAVIGESFGDIFAANCAAIGVPCLRASAADIAALQDAADTLGSRPLVADLKEKTVKCGNLVVTMEIPDGDRERFLDGTWDGMSVLLGAGATIEQTAARLPYLNCWQAE
jgi:3-isopropylmalate/(R)-2-methylmalate dehydratase small subunit